MHSCHQKGRRISAFLIILFAIAVAVVLSCKREGVVSTAYTEEGSDGSYRILLLGQDEAAGLTDVMMLVSVNRADGSVCLAQIPRDTYFRYTKKDYRKINGAMGTLGGPDALCKTLESALAVEIDSYIVLDLSAVQVAVDALGGVEIDVPCDMDYEDPIQGLSIHLKKGRQRLDGAAAAGFVRYRAGYLRGDVGRLDAQKIFMAAFFEAAGERLADDFAGLALRLMRMVRTDMRIDRAISLLRTAKTVSPDKITLLTMPGEEIRSAYSGAWYYVLSRSGTAAVMERFFGVSDAASRIDPSHLFGNPAREDLDTIYKKEIAPEYHTVSEIRANGIALP